MVFGWGFWLWSVPALALLAPAAARDLRGLPGGILARADRVLLSLPGRQVWTFGPASAVRWRTCWTHH
jgi:hypothetical protein